VLSKAIRGKEKIERLLQIAARPGGIRYLATRSRDIAMRLFNRKNDPTNRPKFHAKADRRLVLLRDELGILVRNTVRAKPRHTDVLYIGDIAQLAPLPWRGVRLEDVPDPSNSGAFRDFNVNVSDGPRSEASTLVIYATAGFMSVWDRIQDDLDRYFAAGWQQVLIVLITDRFRRLDFAGHSYLLSLLLNNFPRRKYLPHLDVFIAREPGAERPPAPFRSMFEIVARNRSFASMKANNSDQANSPDEFSALVIAIEPKGNKTCEEFG
jgi:hypothetical protein